MTIDADSPAALSKPTGKSERSCEMLPPSDLPSSCIGEQVDAEPLTVQEQNDLAGCEQLIERGKNTFVEVGLALCRIRDERLYRAAHGSFQEYCEKRWSFGRSYASRLIEAANVAAQLPIGNTVANEAQARELAKIGPAQRVEVLQKAAEENRGTPTAQSIRKVVERRRGATPKPAEKGASLSSFRTARASRDAAMSWWYCRATPKRRGDFLTILVNSAVNGGKSVEVSDLFAFREMVLDWLNKRVKEAQP
ncbi:MAG: hypothetical protein HZA90_06165 [Verrucomicrobia bacterium]|nr:hypothetical protein [Verrucomicrobiota bacterium]